MQNTAIVPTLDRMATSTDTATDPAVPVFIDTKECAVLLHCSPKSLEMDRCRRRWQVPFLRRGRSVIYDRAAVLKWLADHNAPVEA